MHLIGVRFGVTRSGFSYINSPKQSISVRFFASQGDAAAPLSPELLNKTYHQLLDAQVKAYPHKDLLASSNEEFTWTFADTLKHQDSLASGLAERSTKKSCLALALPSRSESFVSQLATARAGYSFAVIQAGLSNQKLENQLKAINPSILAWTPRVHKTVILDQIYEIFPRLTTRPCTLPINDSRFPELRSIFHTSKQSLEGIYAFYELLESPNKHSLARVSSLNNPNTPTFLFDDQNRIITLTQHNIINTGYLTGHRAHLNEEDIILTTLPFHTSAALSLGLGMALSHKLKLVWASEQFDAELVLAGLAKQFATVLLIKPSDLSALLQKYTTSNIQLPSLNKLILVTSPGDLPTDNLLSSLKEVLKTKVIVTFGTNETGGVITTTTFDSPHSTNLVGKPLPHTEIKIVDPQGKPTPPGTPGQLLVKGFNITTGFSNVEAEFNQKKIRNGYLHTGITAILDKSDNLIIS